LFKYYLTLSDPTSDLVRQYDFSVLLQCRKTSDTVLVEFVRPLSEPVRRFSSCSTDFNQQIAQVVLFLFLCAFSFKTVGQLQVINQPLYGPKQIRAGEYAVGRKIGFERVKLVSGFKSVIPSERTYAYGRKFFKIFYRYGDVTAPSEILALGGLRTTDSMTRVEKSWTALSKQNMIKLLCNYISYR
jgi:hypothetical protein